MQMRKIRLEEEEKQREDEIKRDVKQRKRYGKSVEKNNLLVK